MRLIRSVVLLITASVALHGWTASPAPVIAATHLAGHWHVSTSITCVSNGYNLDACQKITGSTFAAFSLQGATITIHSSSDYGVDSRGRFTGHGSSVITEKAHGHGSLRACNPQQVASVLWTGTCFTAWSGRGHIATGKTRMLDFWLDNGTTTIHGTSPFPPYRVHFSMSSDSRIPAQAGVYTTARYFQFLHLAPVRGVSIRTVVTHSS
jgi:hypothetical protein